MANYYIHVGSITNAMRGRRLLEAQGIRAYLQRTTHPSENDGCGYRLLITADPQRAVSVLKDSGVRVIRVSETI